MKMLLRRVFLGLALVVGCAQAQPASSVDVAAFTRNDRFGVIKLSPQGDHVAATAQFDDLTALVIMRRSDRKMVANFSLGKNTYLRHPRPSRR